MRLSRRSRAATQAMEVIRARAGMNRYAAIALTTASFFLIIMAVLVSSPPLFYMATAVICTLGGARLQAWLAVRGLRFERIISPAVRAGEQVTVQITVWSERKLKRPLISLVDHLPGRMVVIDETPSLPIAPSFDQPIQTYYSFRPIRRGRYRWSQLTVYGTDALGLVTMTKTYQADSVDLTVYPAPLPVTIPFTPAGGWGLSEVDSGRSSGSGLETRGIREYIQGDAIKTIHWPSTARTGELMVKEFQSGSGVSIKMILQRESGTEAGEGLFTTLEAMCGHCLYLSSQLLERGARVLLPQIEPLDAANAHPEVRERSVREALTDIQSDQVESLAEEVRRLGGQVQQGETLVVFVAALDPNLPTELARLYDIQKVCLVYDPRDYDPKFGRKAASDAAYLIELERSGAQTIVMPKAVSTE